MTSPRKVNVTIDRLVVDGPVDERALREALGEELRRRLADERVRTTAPAGPHDTAARELAKQVHDALPPFNAREGHAR